MKHVYIAHPLGGGLGRITNIFNAGLWVRWAADQGVMPAATWIILAGGWPETPENRAKGIAIDLEQITRCDELWLCGHIDAKSEGMEIEAAHARSLGKPVIDKRGGFEP